MQKSRPGSLRGDHFHVLTGRPGAEFVSYLGHSEEHNLTSILSAGVGALGNCSGRTAGPDRSGQGKLLWHSRHRCVRNSQDSTSCSAGCHYDHYPEQALVHLLLLRSRTAPLTSLCARAAAPFTSCACNAAQDLPEICPLLSLTGGASWQKTPFPPCDTIIRVPVAENHSLRASLHLPLLRLQHCLLQCHPMLHAI